MGTREVQAENALERDNDFGRSRTSLYDDGPGHGRHAVEFGVR